MLRTDNYAHNMDYRVNHAQQCPRDDEPGSLPYRRSGRTTPMQHNAHTCHQADIGISDKGDALIREWYSIFGSDQEDSLIQLDCVIPLQLLCQLVTNSVGKKLPLRSICWRLFLGILPTDMSHWCITLARERQRYLEIDCMVNPDLQNWQMPEDHPLSQDSYSPWNRHFRAERIKRTIAQDVDRTFPKVQYFRDPRVHKAMVNVLFCYCENYAFQYRQGMHEILAPLFFVLHHDYSTVHQTQSQQHNKSADAQISSILNYCLRSAINPDYLEADAFTMFCVIMNTIQLWYISDENLPEEPKKFRLSSGQKVYRVCTNNRIDKAVKPITDRHNPSLEQLFESPGLCPPLKNPGIRYVDDIHNGLVRQINEALHAHLERLDIFPAIFGLRWIRLLFGHEYSLPDLLTIWDCIFAVGENFPLVRFLYASMLVLLAPKLLTCNFSECLNLLMHYPVNVNSATTVPHILRMALHLYKPNSYHLPMESKARQHNSRTMPRARRARASTLSSPLSWRPPKPDSDSNGDDTGDILKTHSSAKLTRRRISEAFSVSNLTLAAQLDDSFGMKRTVKKSVPDYEKEIRSRSQGGDTIRMKPSRNPLARDITDTLKQALNIRPNNHASTSPISALHSHHTKGWFTFTVDLNSGGRTTSSTENDNAHETDHISQQLTVIQKCNLKRLTDHLNGCATHIDTVILNSLSSLDNRDSESTPGDGAAHDQNWHHLVQLKQAKAQLVEAQHLIEQTSELINSLKTSTTQGDTPLVPMVSGPQHLEIGVASEATGQPTHKRDATVSPLPCGTSTDYELKRLLRLGEPGSVLAMKRFPSVDYGEEVDELDNYSN